MEENSETVTRHPLTKWREARGLNQKAAADLLDLNRPTLCRFEKGRRFPSLTQAAKLSEKTGIPIEQFAPQSEAAQ
jgi:transcriptional regulator with XRE-family HTH domain